MLRILVLDADADRREMLCQALSSAGHHVTAPPAAPLQLSRLIAEHTPDVIIIDTDSPDRDMLEHICVVSRDDPRPIVMFSGDRDSDKIREAVRAGVSAYVVDGLSEQRIQPILDVAIARFSELQALRQELLNTRSKLEERKLIDRAKGILMQARGLSEEDAYEALRKLAMGSSQRIAEVARQVISMRGLLQERTK